MEDLFPLESKWMLAVAAGVVLLLLLWDLLRALPLQNVLLIAVSLLAGEALMEWFIAVKILRLEVQDPKWHYFGGAALLWTAVVLGARRLAKFISYPWRKEKVNWLWLIGLSVVATAAFQSGWPYLDPDFVNQKKVSAMVAVRAVGALVLLLGLAPWFIRKRPHPGEDYSQLAEKPKNETQQKADEQTSA